MLFLPQYSRAIIKLASRGPLNALAHIHVPVFIIDGRSREMAAALITLRRNWKSSLRFRNTVKYMIECVKYWFLCSTYFK